MLSVGMWTDDGLNTRQSTQADTAHSRRSSGTHTCDDDAATHTRTRRWQRRIGPQWQRQRGGNGTSKGGGGGELKAKRVAGGGNGATDGKATAEATVKAKAEAKKQRPGKLYPFVFATAFAFPFAVPSAFLSLVGLRLCLCLR